jgi:23S rRNA pseudouridine2604 synthase
MIKNSPDIQFPIRINSYLAKQGISTRRGADNLIARGDVFINKRKATLGAIVNSGDIVEVRGLDKKDTYTYYAYNKPVGIVTTMAQKDEKDIVTTTKFPEKVFPVGRLDKDSHGLIIMTNDGRITDRLLNPEKVHEKEYVVRVDKDYNDQFLKKLSRGVEFDDYTTKPCKTKRINEDTFRITLTEGKNRQIRKMCAVFGKVVKDLKRTRIMNIEIGRIAPGGYRKLKGEELKIFLNSLGLEK